MPMHGKADQNTPKDTPFLSALLPAKNEGTIKIKRYRQNFVRLLRAFKPLNQRSDSMQTHDAGILSLISLCGIIKTPL